MLMLDTQACGSEPFVAIRDLDQVISYRLDNENLRCTGVDPEPWVTTLAGALGSVILESEEATSRLRATAKRLASSHWFVLPSDQPIVVKPYIEDSPAGPSEVRKVLWQDESIYVTEDSIATYFDELAEELTKAFDNEEVSNAIRALLIPTFEDTFGSMIPSGRGCKKKAYPVGLGRS
jgi:hypothetical protein